MNLPVHRRSAVFALAFALTGTSAAVAGPDFENLKGRIVVALGEATLRSDPPGGLFGAPGGAVGETRSGQKFKVADQRTVTVVFFGRQLWLKLEAVEGGAAGWLLSGNDDLPYQFAKPVP